MWPQISIGRLSCAREMHHLWQVIARRSCLVSGTLYEELPQLSCEAARRALHVPDDDVVTMEPVHAAWQYTPVTVCMIGAVSTTGGRPRYVRPRASGEAAVLAQEAAGTHVEWARDMASYIGMVHRDGAGGMLVLGTAFRDLKAIGELLHAQAPELDLLEHRSGHSLAALRERFLSLAGRGRRPILLAAGGAWTGFDLHCDLNEDACTDLVILNAPFGAISSTLAREMRRQQHRGFTEVASMVSVLVRQGIGRLVRSPGTPPNRRIHWLDARIHQPGKAGLLNPVKRVLSRYRQVTV
jgi:CRISPR type IV-associated DEAD/DEAH-box helicase Csf4